MVNFKTEARFRGQFVMSHPGKTMTNSHTPTYPRTIRRGHSLQPPLVTHPLYHLFLESHVGGSFLCEGVRGHFSKCQNDASAFTVRKQLAYNKVEGHSLNNKKVDTVTSFILAEKIHDCACLFSGTSVSSMVMCADHPGLTFTLALVRTEPTYNQPMQQWSFVSDFAVSQYTIKSLPAVMTSLTSSIVSV